MLILPRFTPFGQGRRMTKDLRLAQAAADGDESALKQLFERHNEKLTKGIRLRLNTRVSVRCAVSDVIQETYIEISKRIADYVANPAVPFHVWLRRIAGQKLTDAHRRHAVADRRTVYREVPASQGADASESLAQFLAVANTTPSMAAIRKELQSHLREALNQMDETDRELLVLRHFEHFSNHEAAAVLEIDPSAASTRYVRALQKLRRILDQAG